MLFFFTILFNDISRIHIDADLIQDVYSQDSTVIDALAQDPSVLEELRSATALSNIGPGMLRNPFHSASILSSITLLRTKQLIKISLHRRTLLEVAAIIRPQKSELLLRVEEKIWDAVLCLARGKTTPLEVLQKLVDEIPWEELEEAAAALQGYAVTPSFQYGKRRRWPHSPTSGFRDI